MAEEFRSAYGKDYGYGGRISNIRDEEFPKLQDMVYLDHTGATLYAKSQLQCYHEDLQKNTYGNPHSGCMSGQKTSQIITDIRQEILSYFNVTDEDYGVVFTTNATAGLKLVAENFQFETTQDAMHDDDDGNSPLSVGSWFVYLQDNHTSVVGIRAVAASKGAEVRPVTYAESSELELNLAHMTCFEVTETNDHSMSGKISCHRISHSEKFAKINHLFAFPAMSNFSGHKYPLEWINAVQNKGPFSEQLPGGQWFVLLDAATFVSTSRLDLSLYKPDFVPISFYKMFGFPTGLGALLVSSRGSLALRKFYFSGGTVAAYSSDSPFHVFKPSLQDRFEDGTSPFLEILSLKYGFESLAKLTTSVDLVTTHTFSLAHFLYNKLQKLRHYNGKKACQLYCDTDYESSSVQGPIINLNLIRSNGDYVGFTEVSKLAAIYNIHLRTGCFCNVGACQHFLNLTSQELESNLRAGHVCGDDVDLINGFPTGSVRISFGYMSDFSDAERFLRFIEECFLETRGDVNDSGNLEMIYEIKQVLKKMFIYPIKSCAAFEVQQWDISEKGLRYDREWLIVNQAGSYLSQKREPRLCLIKPSVDLKRNILRLQAPGMPSFEITLDVPPTDECKPSIVQSRICGTKVSGIDCGEKASEWLSLFLKKKCRLLRQNPNVTRRSASRNDFSKGTDGPVLSLANESQLLLITEASSLALLNEIKASITVEETFHLTPKQLVQRFRPNLVINGTEPYREESWTSLSFGGHHFQCCGVCSRCQMICVDQSNGERSKEPLKTLAKMRGSKIPFGVYLVHVPSQGKVSLSVGDAVHLDSESTL